MWGITAMHVNHIDYTINTNVKCEQIGVVLEGLGNKTSYKSSPNIC